MTAPRPRPMNEPSWCVKPEHPQGYYKRHASEPVRVGDRRDRGQVSAWLTQADQGPSWVLVNVAHMVSASVEISPADAAALRDGLTALLEQAGWFDARG